MPPDTDKNRGPLTPDDFVAMPPTEVVWDGADAAGAAAAAVDPAEIPGYEVLGCLGRGGVSVVYRARQLALNRVVALKLIPGGAHAHPRVLSRFRAEVTRDRYARDLPRVSAMLARADNPS